MKKIAKTICSALCVLSVSAPMNVLAAPTEDTTDMSTDIQDELVDHANEVSQLENDYHLAFLTGDFGLKYASGQIAGEPIDTLVLFVSNPQGKIVKNAQVIYTLIDQAGQQKLCRARPYKGGYVVAVNQLQSGRYRLETEIATDGQLLTDEFFFAKA